MVGLLGLNYEEARGKAGGGPSLPSCINRWSSLTNIVTVITIRTSNPPDFRCLENILNLVQ